MEVNARKLVHSGTPNVVNHGKTIFSKQTDQFIVVVRRRLEGSRTNEVHHVGEVGRPGGDPQLLPLQ